MDEACPPGTMTLCVARSLFTHLDSEMARETLRDIHRALVPHGRAMISMFLLDTSARRLIAQGRSAFQFEHPHSLGTFVQNPRGPLGAIAFTFEHFVQLLTEAGLFIERLLYGSWSGRPYHVSAQDILIIRKMPSD